MKTRVLLALLAVSLTVACTGGAGPTAPDRPSPESSPYMGSGH
ncbi:MAG TPA: hypothetical protein VF263_11650 [Longimicrobiaceae bacterium]